MSTTETLEAQWIEQYFPCGTKTFYGDIKLYEKYGIDAYEKHLRFCKACKVVLGLSKRHYGFTQQEVTQIFQKLDKYPAYTKKEVRTTRGKRSYPFYTDGKGILWHYDTIQAVKTYDGKIIANRDCWSMGFAHCTLPTQIDTFLNLTTLIRNAMVLKRGIKELRKIKLIDIKEDTVLFRIGKRYFLNASDGNQRFIAELVKPCKTIKEAYESMKPLYVKDAERRGLEVKRQGDLFFIPTTLTDKDVKDIVKVRISTVDYGYRQYRYDFPRISLGDNPPNHFATYIGSYENLTVVKGTVRHRQHRMLRLKNVWHIVVTNNVRNAWSVGYGRD